MTFVKNPSELMETRRQPYHAHFNLHRHPRLTPAVYQISINGPYASTGPGNTPSRRRIFVCQPRKSGEEDRCAERILSTLMRRAYRRPVTGAESSGLVPQVTRGASDLASIEISISNIASVSETSLRHDSTARLHSAPRGTKGRPSR